MMDDGSVAILRSFGTLQWKALASNGNGVAIHTIH